MGRQSSDKALATITLHGLDGEAVPSPKLVGPVPRAFPEGARVADRYRVVRFIAEGSYGEVYEVEDLSLHEHVALKTIRPELASRPGVLKRFKRELRLARRVTHPNVCRVFDLGEHRSEGNADSEPRVVTFLTMELLQGQTLREYMAQHGRISPDQILPIAAQMASALDAAQAARIIHRDLKSSNVVLLHTPNTSASPRVVVTDFGLATGTPIDGDPLDSHHGAFIGTPSYMSPEQVEGLPLSPASDIYSLGVVLYEMVTGRLPFEAATPLATAIMRLQVSPLPPRVWVPELDPRWDEVLLRCLAKGPRDRFTTAAEVIAALRAPKLAPAQARSAELPYSRSVAALAPVRQVIAVFPPRNLRASRETAWISTALAEVLSAELAANGKVRLLSGEEVARLSKELSLPEEEGFSRDTLRRIRLHSKVDRVLTGSYLVLSQPGDSRLRLDLSLKDAASGEAVAQLTDTGTEQDLLTLLARIGSELRKQLGLAPLTSEQVREIRTTMPSSAEAARLYAEGLAALRNYDAATAVEWLERVVEQEPHFALAHSALAAACKALFLAERAKDSARRAFELSASLPQEERLLVQARHYEAQADWRFAIEAYQALVVLSPDSVDYGTALVSAQVSAGQAREARTTIVALRQLPPPLCEDARIDLAESLVAASFSDFEASCRHAEAAVETALRIGQRLIVATALIDRAYAVRNLGNPASAVALLQESEQLFLRGGDQGGAIRSMIARSIALTDLTRLREARQVSESVLRLVQGYRGSLIEGEVLGNRGWLTAHLGSLTEALELTRESILLYQALEMPTELAHFSVQLGMVRRYQGALDEAQRVLENALLAARAIGDDFTEAWAHHELGDLFLERGDLVQARSRLNHALEKRQARGLQAFVVATRLSLARLALKQGRLEEALAIAEQSHSFYKGQQNRDKEGLAYALQARALLVGGEFSRARDALVSARALAGQSEDVFIMAEVALTGAWVAARSGTPLERRAAADRLWELVTQTREGGLKGLELQAQLELAELEQASGAEPAEINLLAVEKEALQLGYLAIARRARALARR